MKADISYDEVFSIKSESDFNELALRIFNYQALHVAPYREFIQHMRIAPASVDHYSKIPFLPIQFFKSHSVLTDEAKTTTTFYSSGTSQSVLSQHHVADLNWYDQSLLNGFELAFGPVSSYAIFALLPSYHNNQNASLLYMVDKLVQHSGNEGGFYLENHQALTDAIKGIGSSKKIMLIGVSYALLDLAENLHPNLEDVIIIETGGMKGRRKEMVKSDLHAVLKREFNAKSIGSEYGMTELLSQAWSKGNGVFTCPPWMKVLTREYNDPLTFIEHRTGGINVIDLANVNSCAFIATQDLGRVNGNQFEIIGRFDNADIRGCNLLVN